MITAQLAAALDVAPESLREKDLVPYGPAEVDAITLEGAGGPRRLKRGAWAAPSGVAFRFDGSTPEGTGRAAAAAMDKVWTAVSELSADAFLADGDADKVPGARTVTLTLVPRGGGKKMTVDLGGACPGHPDDVVAIRREEGGARVSACVARGAMDALSIPAAELVDHHVVGARAEEIVDLKLTAGAATLALARSGSEWHLQAPTDRMIAADLGRGFLESLIAVEGKAFAAGDARKLGLDPPRATVRVASLAPDGDRDGGHGERVETLEVGAAEGTRVHVRRVEDGAILDVPRDLAVALLPDEIALRPRKIHDDALRSFQAIRVEAPGRVQRLERNADGVFAIVEPRGEGLIADGGFVIDLAKALGELSAVRWVGAAKPEHALDRPRMTISAELGEEGSAQAHDRGVNIWRGDGGRIVRAGGGRSRRSSWPRRALRGGGGSVARRPGALTVDVGKGQARGDRCARRRAARRWCWSRPAARCNGKTFVGGAADAEATALRAAAVRDALVQPDGRGRGQRRRPSGGRGARQARARAHGGSRRGQAAADPLRGAKRSRREPRLRRAPRRDRRDLRRGRAAGASAPRRREVADLATWFWFSIAPHELVRRARHRLRRHGRGRPEARPPPPRDHRRPRRRPPPPADRVHPADRPRRPDHPALLGEHRARQRLRLQRGRARPRHHHAALRPADGGEASAS